ncbi:T9SS type A sorting domain-containing protein [Pontibacter chitinilyticus]|uniref:T9SS type A sorting domain-containing protein n=1 Tax=Pontibacter chitinilyticus TaxID=2674989 RepID=UPI0032191160
MKKNLFILFALLLLSIQSFAQVSGSSFEMYVMNYRFGPRSLDYFQSKNIEVTNFLAENAIAQDWNNEKVDAAKVRRTLRDLFPSTNSGGKIVVDWERKGVFKALRDYPATDSRYKNAEAEWRKLIGIIRDTRPNVKIGIYGIPFKAWKKSTVGYYNPKGKYDKLLSLVDFLAPTLYIQFADEEVGHARNIEYMQNILDSALDYGKRLHKPVYPFLWGRIHDTNPIYGYELIQINVFAQYVKFISTHTYNGYKAKGFYWWEAIDKGKNLSKVRGLRNWARGMVNNYDSYDALMVKYAAAVVKTLADKADTQNTEDAKSSDTKAASYTLFDAKTGKDIQTLSNGATLDLANLPTKNLNIRYNTSSKIGSVKFSLNGEQNKDVTESFAPYEIMGDKGSWTPTTGNYTLRATPYSSDQGKGKAGSSLTVKFKVVNTGVVAESKQQGNTFTLVNAVTNKDIQTLPNGATINLAALPTKNLNIRFNPSSSVGSVVLAMSGRQSMKVTESGAPYTFEDENGNYKNWSFATGNYTVKATPYSENGGRGRASSSTTIKFTVVNNPNSSIGVTSLASNAVASSATSENSLSSDELTVYPVPAITVLHVELGKETAEGAATVELKNFDGKAVLTKKVNTTTDGRKVEFDLSGIKKGMYVLSVTSSAGRTTKRVVVE